MLQPLRHSAAILVLALGLAYPLKSLGNHCQKLIPQIVQPEGWNNESNIDFYEGMEIRSFQARAHTTHVDERNDLKNVAPWINAVAVPLRTWEKPIFVEVGAGYGRVVDFLRQGYPGARILAYEHAPSLAAFLKQKYRQDEDIKVMGRSFLGPRPVFNNRRVRAQGVFLFWSAFIEFNREEQFELTRQIAATLSKSGIAIIDNPIDYPMGGKITVDSRWDGDEVTLEQNGRTYHAFNPSVQLLHDQLKHARLRCVEEIEYENGHYRRKIHVVAHQNLAG